MLAGQPALLQTERLVLRPIEAAHAEAMWAVLGDPALYEWIDRPPPASLEALTQRFTRIAQSIAPGRAEQWLNWTVWTGANDQAIGIVEATVTPAKLAHVAYMFAAPIWGKGYAREAMTAALDAMSQSGARAFDATIDCRNLRSLALVERLGFARVSVNEAAHEEIWARDG